MKKNYIIFILVLSFLQSHLFAQPNDWKVFAKKIIDTNIQIKPGNVVVVSGGKHTIPFMEALAIEIQKKGGMAPMLLSSDKVLRSFYLETPKQYLSQEERYLVEWIKNVDVWISLPTSQNPKATFADIPEERRAAALKAGKFLDNKLNELGIRGLYIPFPTPEQAKFYGLDFSTYEKMQWDAINVDYQKLSDRAARLKAILKNARLIEVTSPAGTHFTFKMGNHPIFVDDGILSEEDAKSGLFLNRWISLPSGSVFFAPMENSADGKVMIQNDFCNYKPLTDISFTFKKGLLTNFKAAKGSACFQKKVAQYPADVFKFSYFSIGLNPALKVIDDRAHYRPGDAAGMVWIGIGDNTLYGGNIKAQNGSFSFPIVNATVKVDGKTIVKDGRLKL